MGRVGKIKVTWDDTDHTVLKVNNPNEQGQHSKSTITCELHHLRSSLGQVDILFDSGCHHNLIGIDHHVIGKTELHKLPQKVYFTGAFSSGTRVVADHFITVDIKISLVGGDHMILNKTRIMVVNGNLNAGIIIGAKTMNTKRK